MKTTAENTPDKKIPGRWRFVVRGVWVTFVLLLLASFIIGFPARFNELRVACGVEACQVLALSPQEAGILQDFGLSLDFYGAYHIGLEIIVIGTFMLLAGLMFWRKSGDWMGLFVSVALLSGAVGFSQVDDALVRMIPSLRGPHEILNSFASVMFVLVLLMFPNGRFAPGWTRILPILFAGITILDLIGPRVFSYAENIMVMVVFLVTGVFLQIYRYWRVSSPSERQQTKWVVFGFLALFIAFFLWNLFVSFLPLQPGLTRLTFYTIGYVIEDALILVFPVSVALSIMRYRLWDIDLVINRAIVYALLTGTLALVYFGSVVLFQSLFRTLTGQGSLAIVASTLAIAALFNPLRGRIQDFIDRRFFRSKYDAEKALNEFAIVARDEVDMVRVSGSLLSVVESTMQPEETSLWLRETARGE